ncbi:MAG: radical SAM protein [bacterium]
MKVLLLNPPRANEITADNPTFIDDERGFNPPLGLLYLAAYLKEHTSHQVFGLDAQVEELQYNEYFKNKIKNVAPDVVGITVMTFTLPDVIKTVKIVKSAAQELNKNIKVILGGPHAHLYPEETLNLDGVDFVIKGEGEIPFANLLDALEDGSDLSDISGLVCNYNGRLINNPISDLIENLDDLPIPDRELLPIEKYNSILSGGHIVTTMFTSRGCPFQCAFCDRPHLGKKFRARGAMSVVDEMEKCLSLGIQEILIYDDTFTVDRQRVVDICNEINKRDLNFTWDIRARVDTVDEEIVRKLKSAGCQRIHFGVEAGTERILKVLNKGINLEQIECAFAIANKVGLETLAYFMVGAPTETKEDILATIKFAKKINPDYAHITILTPYPATKIYEQALNDNIIKKDYWREFAENPENGVVTQYWEKDLSREELFKFLEKFYKDFYGRLSYMLKQVLKIRSWHDFQKRIKAGLKILGMR